MSGRARAGKSGLLTLELLLAVGIFAFCASICVGLFARADALSRRSAELDRAVAEAQNVAELFRASGGDTAETAALAGGWVEQGLLRVAYDGNWQPLSSDEGAVYLLDLLAKRSDQGYVEAALQVWNGDEREEPILSWSVAALEVKS